MSESFSLLQLRRPLERATEIFWTQNLFRCLHHIYTLIYIHHNPTVYGVSGRYSHIE